MIETKPYWPKETPDVPPDPHGWLTDANKALLASFLSPRTKVVIELGSWLGMSTRFILDHAPNAVVVAVDTWLGSPEHLPEGNPGHDKLPTLYETFLVNCWEYKERLIPLRVTTGDGLRLVNGLGLAPDLVYVDADHSYAAVRSDITLALNLFPNAQIVGDDWGIGPPDFPVRRAAIDVAEELGFSVRVVGDWAWCYETGGSPERKL